MFYVDFAYFSLIRGGLIEKVIVTLRTCNYWCFKKQSDMGDIFKCKVNIDLYVWLVTTHEIRVLQDKYSLIQDFPSFSCGGVSENQLDHRGCPWPCMA